MKEFIKNNLILILAFALPIGLIIIVAITAYIPSAFLSTDYNFVYASCNEGNDYYSFRCESYLHQKYSVTDNKLVVNEINPEQDSDKDGIPDINEGYDARIFIHDTEKNESREITLEEAQNLTLDVLITSPDGVSVSNYYDRGPEFFLFFNGGSSYGYYLTKGSSRSKLNLINRDDRYYYRDNFRFIGWVIPGRNR